MASVATDILTEGPRACGRDFVPDTEGAAYVPETLIGIQSGLGVGAPAPFQDVGAEIGAQGLGKFRRNHLRLIVPAAELAPPVKRHRNYRIHVLEVLHTGELRAKKRGKPSARCNVPSVLKRLGDTLVGVLIVVIQKRRRIGVLHLLIRCAYPLQRGVEAVRHNVVGLFPRVGKGKVCGAPDAQLLLPCSKLPAAY